MINLLPPEVKNSYKYARSNRQLRRWVFIFLGGLIGLVIIVTYGLLNITQSTADYTSRIAASEALLQQGKFAETQAKVQDISNSFNLVVKVLGQEVLFSELIKQIAVIIPANANLQSLNINQVQGAIDISAIATDYSTATQVQVNLADSSNKIFSKADIVNISCGSASAVNPAFPCTVNIRALFAANNPFLLINSKRVTP